ncbi:MAG: type II secretion system protein GspC [Deltaproteobacteria bacterium]|nr:type II secretion system protein GspC [Deltaproteobacteria bacterium]
MESFLRKHFWAVDLFAAGVCGLFLARATSGLAESELVRATPAHAPPLSAVRNLAAKDKGFEPVLKRNMFCSSCPPIEDTPEAVSASDPLDPTSANLESVRTSMPISLMAVMYAPPPAGIRYSMAVIRDTETLGSGAFAVGDAVRDAKVIGIEETRVHFDNQGKAEYLDLFAAPEPPPDVKAAAAEGEKKAPSDELAAELDRGLKQTGDHNYELQKGTLEQLLGNMALLSRSARIVPEIRDGKPAGFRLYSVRPEGPFAKIGMQNSDVIYAINGLEMSSPEKALEVYSKLKSARHLSVSLERNGQKITKEYNIR